VSLIVHHEDGISGRSVGQAFRLLELDGFPHRAFGARLRRFPKERTVR
jgi:hypothetical protein